MKLILHIGAGKTGSTSIQNTLKLNDLKLKQKGVLYLGLMLENATEVKYNWQTESHYLAMKTFFSLPKLEAKKQILNVLHSTIKYAKLHNFHTLVWSNEAFYKKTRKHNFISALKQLKSEGVEIELVVYVRRYDEWAVSAYAQWGIKRKIHEGKLKNFRQWVKKTPPRFYETIQPLLLEFPQELKVRNMNAVGDVSKDFMSIIGVDGNNLEYRRDNTSLSNEELFFRALFNDQFQRAVRPDSFDKIFKKSKKRINFSQTAKDYLQHLMPTEKDLRDVCKESEEDRKHINEILVEQGGIPFGEESVKTKDIDIDNDKILMALANIVMRQSRQIDQLEQIIRKNQNELQ